VLKPFLIASTKSELRTVFGPVLAYGVTDATSRGAVFFQEEISKARPDQPTEPTHSFMFRLRGEHLEAFRPQLEADFIKRLARHLRSEHAGVVDCPDQKLSERVLFGLERARRYQMRRESNLATFVALMFEFAPAFDEHPHVKQILTSADVAPEDRMNVLVEEVTEDDWEAIKQSKKLSAWDE
jgi:hypothetical protein